MPMTLKHTRKQHIASAARVVRQCRQHTMLEAAAEMQKMKQSEMREMRSCYTTVSRESPAMRRKMPSMRH